jgi:hypothetical protein
MQEKRARLGACNLEYRLPASEEVDMQAPHTMKGSIAREWPSPLRPDMKNHNRRGRHAAQNANCESGAHSETND